MYLKLLAKEVTNQIKLLPTDVSSIMSSNFSPYKGENLEKWLTTVFTGLFLFVVLYIYKAYDIDQVSSYSGHSLLFRSITHALATSLLFFTSEFLLGPYFNIESNVKQVLWIACVILIGANISFLIFNYFWSWTELYWSSYWLFYYEYPLVVIVPILLARFIGDYNKRREYIPSQTHIVFTSANGKKSFRIKPEHLLFIQSFGNYVEINFSVNGEIKKYLLRNKLKELECKHTTSSYLVRCHRSYLVNPKKIDHLVEDTKSLHLNLGYASIPVSKKYIDVFQ